MKNTSCSCPEGSKPRASCARLDLPELHITTHAGTIPDEDACHALWDKYAMFDNVRRHSALVARTAVFLAKKAQERGLPVNIPEVRASGLLHDLAKTYCILHGGGHARLGASWVIQETGCQAIAQGVFHHVFWPWPLAGDEPEQICSLPLFIIYADKRARHDTFVTLEERFSDLLVRYGDSESHRDCIRTAHAQGLAIEKALSRHLGIDLASVTEME